MSRKEFSILFFLPSLGGGGAEMHAVRLAHGLLRYNVQLTYVVCSSKGTYHSFLPPSVRLIVLPTEIIPSSLLRIIFSFVPLGFVIRRVKPDLLCPIMLSSGLVMAISLLVWRVSPLVTLCLQCSVRYSHLQNPRLYERLELFLLKKLSFVFDHVIALSQGVASEITELIPAFRFKTSVIPNVGMPLQSQITCSVNLSVDKHPGDIIICSSGRLTAQKDYATLLKALRLLNRPCLKLFILGEGELKSELSSLAQQLEVHKQVKFLGFQKNPYDYMRISDIFVLSSMWEGFGNVIVEAMHLGLPVVATDCPHGPSEIISNGVNGLLVPPKSPLHLADCISLLLDSPNLRARLSAQAILDSKLYSCDKVGQSYYQLFSRLMAESGNEPWLKHVEHASGLP